MNYNQYQTLPVKYIVKKINEFRIEDIPEKDITT